MKKVTVADNVHCGDTAKAETTARELRRKGPQTKRGVEHDSGFSVAGVRVAEERGTAKRRTDESHHEKAIKPILLADVF